jgi:hypothetical protein
MAAAAGASNLMMTPDEQLRSSKAFHLKATQACLNLVKDIMQCSTTLVGVLDDELPTKLRKMVEMLKRAEQQIVVAEDLVHQYMVSLPTQK